MRRIALAIALPALVSSGTPSNAGFERWTAETEHDPFSSGTKVVVSYMTSLRSGVLITCNTSDRGITVRAVPGYVYNAKMEEFEPFMEFAFDSKRMSGKRGVTAAVGDNLAAVDAFLEDAAAAEFVVAFANAKRQIAIKDGMSDQPHLLTAAGSTAAGKKLADCYNKQSE